MVPMTNIQWHLAHNVKARRNILSLTQAALAERAGTSANYVAQIERSEKFPSPNMIERLARALEVDSTELFARCPEQFTNPWNWDKKN